MIKKHTNLKGRLNALSIALLLCLTLGGCSSTTFDIKDLAKFDIDSVADAHRAQVDHLLGDLLIKLYKRNPRELGKSPGASVTTQQQKLSRFLSELDELQSAAERADAGKRALLSMNTALSPNYKGDRVFLLMQGLSGMISQAYNNKREFFVLDQLDEQKLYNSARNIEIVMWRLRTKRDERGDLLLLTNGLSGESQNLSFERLFGKLIQLQDMMATIASGRTQRTIAYVTKSVATMTFMPL